MATFSETLSLTYWTEMHPASCFLNWLVQELERRAVYVAKRGNKNLSSIWEPRGQRHWLQKALPETNLFIQGHTMLWVTKCLTENHIWETKQGVGLHENQTSHRKLEGKGSRAGAQHGEA